MRGLVAEPVPGDGSCLFHSVGRHVGASASDLRRAVVAVLRRHPDLDVVGCSLADWTQWYAGKSIGAYADELARPGAWGGGLELAILARMYGRPIDVFERRSGDGPATCQRISRFESPRPGRGAPLRLLYTGRSHYMPLLPR